MSNKRTIYTYHLSLNGLFGRNRKVKHDMFKLIDDLSEPLTREAALALADNKIKELKVKGQAHYFLYEREGTVEYDSGIRIYSTDLFGGQKEIQRGTINNG
jgi:hypothetical protein